MGELLPLRDFVACSHLSHNIFTCNVRLSFPCQRKKRLPIRGSTCSGGDVFFCVRAHKNLHGMETRMGVWLGETGANPESTGRRISTAGCAPANSAKKREEWKVVVCQIFFPSVRRVFHRHPCAECGVRRAEKLNLKMETRSRFMGASVALTCTLQTSLTTTTKSEVFAST